eukprot:m.128150 g.128150  ORF g.128150 m.128150 type:complete len:101 (+) comp37945_c0_seq1:99-401(+)
MPPLFCIIPKPCVQKSNLQTHIRSYHEGARPFVCQEDSCLKAFAHKKSLDDHIQRCHNAASTEITPPKKESSRRRRRTLAKKISGYDEFVQEGKPSECES